MSHTRVKPCIVYECFSFSWLKSSSSFSIVSILIVPVCFPPFSFFLSKNLITNNWTLMPFHEARTLYAVEWQHIKKIQIKMATVEIDHDTARHVIKNFFHFFFRNKWTLSKNTYLKEVKLLAIHKRTKKRQNGDLNAEKRGSRKQCIYLNGLQGSEQERKQIEVVKNGTNMKRTIIQSMDPLPFEFELFGLNGFFEVHVFNSKLILKDWKAICMLIFTWKASILHFFCILLYKSISLLQYPCLNFLEIFISPCSCCVVSLSCVHIRVP